MRRQWGASVDNCLALASKPGRDLAENQAVKERRGLRDNTHTEIIAGDQSEISK